MIGTVAVQPGREVSRENLGKCGMMKVQAFRRKQAADVGVEEVNGEGIARKTIDMDRNTCTFLGEGVVIVSSWTQ
jgi:hypothetical protein